MPDKQTPLLCEESVSGRCGALLPRLDVPQTPVPETLLRDSLKLPELDECTVVRHFTLLSQKNFSVDSQFYPLGSCTMKYNPKMNEDAAAQKGFRQSHPLSGDSANQGNLELMYKLQEALKAITGFVSCTLQPAAGAHGELTGILMIRAWHLSRRDKTRNRILVPDSAHGTNPATCTMAGYITETIPSDAKGAVDLDALKEAVAGGRAKTVAGMMITNPGTQGLFEIHIADIIKIIHDAGGLVYGDGANMNALMGIVKPAELGFDVMHLNLHKTFSTPHGGGGPGAGAVIANKTLAAFLPGPIAAKNKDAYELASPEQTIGAVKSFHGNFAVLVRAYAYIRALGADGLKRASQYAVLNANYLRHLCRAKFPTPYGAERPCMHEFTASPNLGNGVHTLDIAKRLIDYGFHPPTIYFPLTVKEAFMAEPTETETMETLEAFAGALEKIAAEAEAEPELLHDAPHHTPVGRLDEVAAARNLKLRW
ncbi:MAG: aminomethyl-transferring glycine dehydrogenase subunit GcvPB [Treponema sp.]|jgi:glycine dehydrogenase subunit 2|nr:aminomethyl-transferring glycine dehydrogenase subunit GcvPB [Treponema sp.]